MRVRLVVLVALIIALLVIAPGASAASTTLAALKGMWSGQLVGASPAIQMSLRVSGGTNGLTVRSRGGIICTGRETYTGRKGEGFTFRERITGSQLPSCVGLGNVTITLRDDDRLLRRG